MTTTNTYSKSEIGHIKNIENFYDLIQICNRYGADYNPTATDIQIPNLQTSYETFVEKQDQVNQAFANLTGKINDRQYTFEKLRPLTSRVLTALEVATDDKKLVADARKFGNKIQGRAPKVKTNDNEEGQETKEPKSNSQQSFDKLIEHFENILHLLRTVPNYTPNETELTILELTNFLEEMKTVDKQYVEGNVPYRKALTERDNTLYDEKKGVVALAKRVKLYVKSIYGSTSLEFKEINKLQFRTKKRK